MAKQPARQRRAGPVILVDESGAVLLFRGGDPARPEAGTWWFPPGGAVEPGESVADSAQRELREETGLDVQDLGPIVLQRQVEYEFERVHYSQYEAYFLVRCNHSDISNSGWTPGERQVVEAHRWWSLDDLRATAEIVYPVGLVASLEGREESQPRPLYKIDDSHHIRIETAAEHLDLVPTIADWRWTEWGHADSDGSAGSWGKALPARTSRDRLPATWIAMAEGQPVGSVSRAEHDMPDRPDLAAMSPWLAGLYVMPTHRRLGIATQLPRPPDHGAVLGVEGSRFCWHDWSK